MTVLLRWPLELANQARLVSGLRTNLYLPDESVVLDATG
jgi:hypothetical protein